jgi:hypothetical protein
MRRITVIPPGAMASVEPMLEAAGWRAKAARPGGDGGDDPAAAMDVVRRGDPALYVPEKARTGTLRRILVVHEGGRGDRAGMDAADDAAVATGAEIIVLHVPPATPSTTSASLPFRVADHGTYDWAEWRDEFMRRFCRCSPGVRVTLQVSAGSMETLRNQIRGKKPDLVIVSGPAEGEGDAEEAHLAVLAGVVPVLMVPSVGRDRSTRNHAELSQRR